MEEEIKLLEEMKANCIKGMMKGAIYTDVKAEKKALAIDSIIKGYKEKDDDLYAANQIIGDQLDIIRDLERQIKIKDAYCNLIYMIGVDYDGLNSIGSLKSLIDELVAYAKRAVKNDDKYIVAESLNDKCYNILYEEVEKPENFESMFKE